MPSSVPGFIAEETKNRETGGELEKGKARPSQLPGYSHYKAHRKTNLAHRITQYAWLLLRRFPLEEIQECPALAKKIGTTGYCPHKRTRSLPRARSES